MPPADAPARARKAAPARRGPKILAALVAGASVDAIAESEGLSRKRVETLAARRTQAALGRAGGRLRAPADRRGSRRWRRRSRPWPKHGDLPAIDRMLQDPRPARPLSRLQQADAGERRTITKAARERLLAKTQRAGARCMIAARKPSHERAREAGASRARRAARGWRGRRRRPAGCCATSALCSNCRRPSAPELLAALTRESNATSSFTTGRCWARATSGRRRATGSIG